MFITACYIVKNEETSLPLSLQSLQGNYDELVVVDTGSTDKTIEIAESYGAKVYSYVWHGDFSAARNFALSKAHGEWILFFDADEYYEVGGSIREYLMDLARQSPHIEAVIVHLDNLESPELPSMKVIRMFRNNPAIHYAGAVHEQIVKDGGGLQIVIAAQFQFMHTGYSAIVMPAKLQRNLELMKTDMERNGDNEKYYYYIAECYFGLQKYPQAIEYILKALESPIVYKYELANYYHILLESMRQCQYPAEDMEKVCNLAIELFPEMPEFYGEQGMIVSSMGRLEEALQLLYKCIEYYNSPERKENDYGYFDNQVMKIVYARLTEIKNLLAEKEKREIKEQVVICVPIYKTELSVLEKIALKQLNKVLGAYRRVFIAPYSLSFNYDEYNMTVERFPDYYFENVGSYSALMLNVDFYRRFNDYEYLLIYQTDAFVFKDTLKEFCELGYDYIGAPIKQTEPMWHALGARVGNGGLSLRNVSAAIRVLELWDNIIEDNPLFNIFSMWEDLFWGYCGQMPQLNFSVPPLETALQFSVQDNIGHVYERMQNGWLPFGCHGWSQIDYKFWHPLITAQGYCLEWKVNSDNQRLNWLQVYLETRNSVNMRVLWGLYRQQKYEQMSFLLSSWLEKYPANYLGWNLNMIEFIMMWRVIYNLKSSCDLHLNLLIKLSQAIHNSLMRDVPYPWCWNLLITMIPYLNKHDCQENKKLEKKISNIWWNMWIGNSTCEHRKNIQKKRKIVVLTSVHNENELLESFVRHTLTFSDAILLDVHNATESAKYICSKLEQEGLPIIIHEKRIIEEDVMQDVDFVISLSPTEFLVTLDREKSVRDILECLPIRKNYTVETDDYAPYAPYAHKEKFILWRPLVRRVGQTRYEVKIKGDTGSNMKAQNADDIFLIRFGHLDMSTLNYGVIPVDTTVVNLIPFASYQELKYMS